MFTGIITHIGRLTKYNPGRQELSVEAPSLVGKLQPGDSLAVNGVCLSLIREEKNILYFNLSEESLKKCSLGALHQNERLNLELPLTLSSPLGGHLVTGHIDGIGKITNIKTRKNGKRFTISFPLELKPFFVPKGSVSIDGVSLTVAELSGNALEVEVIPITLKNTNISQWRHGRAVNIECDIIGKYVYNWTVK